MNAQAKIEPTAIPAVLAQVLPVLGAVHKNKKNPAFKSSYADLSAVLTAIAPIAEHGLWFRQVPVQIDGGIGIETFYVHESGAELSAGITPVPVNKNDAQGLGSAMTYGRRYGLMTAFGLSADDDDGNAAARAAPRQQTAAPLTDDQWSKIVTLCKATRITGDEVKKQVGAGNLKLLTPKQYDDAVSFLEDKLSEAVKAETNAEAREAADA